MRGIVRSGRVVKHEAVVCSAFQRTNGVCRPVVPTVGANHCTERSTLSVAGTLRGTASSSSHFWLGGAVSSPLAAGCAAAAAAHRRFGGKPPQGNVQV